MKRKRFTFLYLKMCQNSLTFVKEKSLIMTGPSVQHKWTIGISWTLNILNIIVTKVHWAEILVNVSKLIYCKVNNSITQSDYTNEQSQNNLLKSQIFQNCNKVHWADHQLCRNCTIIHDNYCVTPNKDDIIHTTTGNILDITHPDMLAI